MKATFGQFEYLKNFVGPVQPRNFKQQDALVVLAESDEAANHLFDNQVSEVLTKLGEHVHEIHITDQKTYNNYPLWLKATLFIDTSSEEKIKESARLIKLIFYLVDRAVTLRLGASARAQAEKVRKSADKLRQKAKAEENEEAEM